MAEMDIGQKLAHDLEVRLGISVEMGETPTPSPSIEPVLIFLDYGNDREGSAVSFALPIRGLYDGGNFSSNRCWSTCTEMKPFGDNDDVPKLHHEYGVLKHGEHILHPYSARLDDCVCDIDTIEDIVSRLYQHTL